MLHFYDKTRSTSLLAFAVAGGLALAPAAVAATGCNLTDGYASSLTAYVSEVDTCLQSSSALNADMANSVIDRMNGDRDAQGLIPLKRLDSLDKAAAAHALDMMTRRYANHVDQEGRNHVYRIRAFDRTMLIGDTGANVLVTKVGASAQDIYVSMQEDELNARNLRRDGFTHVGMAVAVKNGQAFVVQVFAAVEGELRQAVPLTVSDSVSVKAKLTDPKRETLGWGLKDEATGELLARSKASRMKTPFLTGTNAAVIDIVVSDQAATYVLKGPMISAQ